nr:MAG TPA: hypothetical protein [Caudoviricetes sp.]
MVGCRNGNRPFLCSNTSPPCVQSSFIRYYVTSVVCCDSSMIFPVF